MELLTWILFQVIECVSHLSVYLPKQARNPVTPSRLLMLDPDCRKACRGFFVHGCTYVAEHRDVRERRCRTDALMSRSTGMCGSGVVARMQLCRDRIAGQDRPAAATVTLCKIDATPGPCRSANAPALPGLLQPPADCGQKTIAR